MEYRTLGRSGCAVSALCLGTMTFGNESDEKVSHAQLDMFVEAGGTFVDTADVYSAGESERIIGRWLASRPASATEPIVLATKGRFPMASDPNGAGLSARHLTSTRPTRGTRTPRSKRRCARWTVSSGPARSATTASPTSPAGS